MYNYRETVTENGGRIRLEFMIYDMGYHLLFITYIVEQLSNIFGLDGLLSTRHLLIDGIQLDAIHPDSIQLDSIQPDRLI